jgi:endonuclease G
MKSIPRLLAAFTWVAFLFVSCKKELASSDSPVAPGGVTNQTGLLAVTAAPLTEGFESGSKTAYAAADVTLGSGSWNFDDALIGVSTSDRKNGSQSVRIRNTGSIRMNFDYGSGATTITVAHAVYGADGSSTWELQVSTNGGTTYTKVGSTVTSSSTTLQTASFTVSLSGNMRVAIVKTGGGANRINIDDVQINPASGGGGTGGDDSNLLMGNPSGATADIANYTNYLMVKTYYTLSYNRNRGEPNWVSWHVQGSDLGSTARQDDFRADTTLPSGWWLVSNTSYSGSGFDRGHNCPSADRTSSVAANSATFLMSNMIPQAPNNNEHTWANMESYIRTLVTGGSEVYIIMGSYGSGGTGSNGPASTVNNGHVTVPSNVWKVVVVLSNGSGDLSRVTTSTRVIAVNTPNINTINSDWKQYRTSVNAIEAATGYDLLSNVPASVQQVVEAQVDNL